MSVQVKEDNTKKVQDELKKAFDRALEKVGLTAERYAKALTPVDTGNLRNSVTHTVDSGNKATYIGTNVDYAPFIELGHHSYPGANGGKGFLRPAAADHGTEYRGIIEKELKG